MPLPEEYIVGDIIKGIDDVVVYRGEHPIHGAVNIHLPDPNLPSGLLRKIQSRLYQKGLKMREFALLDIPYISKVLEVSQNPNDPYIVTRYIEHDLEQFIENGVTLRPKRMFTILSQVLEAVTYLTVNGWEVNRIHPRQIKLPEVKTGDISFDLAEGYEQQSGIQQITATVTVNDSDDESLLSRTTETGSEIEGTQQITGDETLDTPSVQSMENETLLDDFNDPRQIRRRRRGIYLLGNTTYQLLFGRKYDASDEYTKIDFKELGKRWRNILAKSLDQDIEKRYSMYEAMRVDVRRALNRNKRIAAMFSPLLIVLVIIAGYLGYVRYHEYKIMTSPAGQAIESFLEIVSKTKDEFPELEKPKPSAEKADDKAILKPFEKIGSVEKN